MGGSGTVTEPTGDAAAALSWMRGHDHLVLTTHVRADGDGIGSELALRQVLEAVGVRATVLNSEHPRKVFHFLRGADEIRCPEQGPVECDGVVTLDCGSWERVGHVRDVVPDDVPVLNVDHHTSNTLFGAENWVDPTAAATGAMILQVADLAEVELTRDLALPLFVSYVEDTGSFRFSNTGADTLRDGARLLAAGVRPEEVTRALERQQRPEDIRLRAMAASDLRVSGDGRTAWIRVTLDMVERAGAALSESQPVVQIAKSVKGVETAVLFVENDDGTKVSVRTEQDVDGAALLSKWGGGGHPRAAGCSFPGRKLEDVERLVLGELGVPEDEVERASSTGNDGEGT